MKATLATLALAAAGGFIAGSDVEARLAAIEKRADRLEETIGYVESDHDTRLSGLEKWSLRMDEALGLDPQRMLLFALVPKDQLPKATAQIKGRRVAEKDGVETVLLRLRVTAAPVKSGGAAAVCVELRKPGDDEGRFDRPWAQLEIALSSFRHHGVEGADALAGEIEVAIPKVYPELEFTVPNPWSYYAYRHPSDYQWLRDAPIDEIAVEKCSLRWVKTPFDGRRLPYDPAGPYGVRR